MNISVKLAYADGQADGWTDRQTDGCTDKTQSYIKGA